MKRTLCSVGFLVFTFSMALGAPVPAPTRGQGSAEYRGLCYQTFHGAALLVDQAVAAVDPDGKPLAVIADLDGTLIDSSAYDAWLIGQESTFSSKTWLLWEQAAQARAVPGALDFLTNAAEQGVEVFYVTNRDRAGLEATLANLMSLGFPFVDARHVLVSTGSSNKQPRFDQIAKDYSVVLYVGDNVNDFPLGAFGQTANDRSGLVDLHQKDFGTKWIVVPSPVPWGESNAPSWAPEQ